MSQSQDSESEKQKSEFEKAAQERQLSLVLEFLLFLRENKKWWMIPILIALSFVGLLVALGGTGAAPFIYTLF